MAAKLSQEPTGMRPCEEAHGAVRQMVFKDRGHRERCSVMMIRRGKGYDMTQLPQIPKK